MSPPTPSLLWGDRHEGPVTAVAAVKPADSSDAEQLLYFFLQSAQRMCPLRKPNKCFFFFKLSGLLENSEQDADRKRMHCPLLLTLGREKTA